ncbi:MAG: hypothetical protein ACI93N_001223 [Flavobacteriaceae bacterium]|jgi:hypothetical protein
MNQEETPIIDDERFKNCFVSKNVNYAKRKACHPRLLSVNHIELHKSKVTRDPIAFIGLWFIGIYWKIKKKLKSFQNWLYPRKLIIYGTEKNSEIIGKLLFGQKTHDDVVPIHNMHLEFWGKTLLGSFRRFGFAISNENGEFSISFDLHACQKWYITSLRVEIYHTGNHIYKDGKPLNKYILFHTARVKKADLIGLEMDLGKLRLFYWEYDYNSPITRVIIKDHDKDAPEEYSAGRLETMEKQFIPIELIKLKHLAEIALIKGDINIKKIQKDYPLNLTQCMELKEKGITRSDDWFGERFMNGMAACDFDKDPNDSEKYWVHYHWNSYDKTQDYAMPDVDIKFKLKANGLPTPVEITLTGPLNKHELNERPKRVFLPTDGEKWMAAKRLARVSSALYTECVHHLCITHYNAEQFSIAAHRNLRLNPLTNLLFPHLKEASLVNHTADRILIGNGYISKATALTKKGILQLALQNMGTQDWKNWKPIQPISEKHTFAKTANLFWEIITSYVNDYVEENRTKIVAHWHEIYRFSEDLVAHSSPYFLCNYLTNMILDNKGNYDANKSDWYETSQRMDQSIERPIINGEKKSMSHITITKNPKDVKDEDIDNLKQACSFIMYHSSFGHTWSNSKQYDDIGEVLYCSLGLRFGTSDEGALGPESDMSIAPDLTRSTQMMWWSNMLSKTGYGFITKNEDNDINPKLIEALKAKEKDFNALGFNIDTIQSRTNI